MSDQSAIQWTDSTWNVVTGCTRVGPGCARCYIERTPPFRMQHRKFVMVGQESTTGVTLHWDRLSKVPRGPKVFTPSLGDLFHEDVPNLFIAEVFDVMRLHPDRIFQVLTKRPERAREWFAAYAPAFERFTTGTSPLPNVWLGVSIENARYTWRADVLREIPAAVRFISAEPLLGSLYPKVDVDERIRDRYAGVDRVVQRVEKRAALDLSGIDWVIIGGESGPGARPFHLDHAREIIRAARGQCDGSCGGGTLLTTCTRCVGPAVFVKQLGANPITQDDGWIRAGKRLADRKGGDMAEWPADLRIREFPRTAVPA